MVWLLYLALEPAVRSRWPHAIVTWNRVLAGRWKDRASGLAYSDRGGAWDGNVDPARNHPIAEPKNTLETGIALWPLLGARSWVAAYVC